MRTTIITNLILPAELRSCGQLMIFVFFCWYQNQNFGNVTLKLCVLLALPRATDEPKTVAFTFLD